MFPIMPILLLSLGTGILSEILIIILIFVVIFIVFKLGGLILRAISGLIINSLLGLITIFVLNTYFGLGIVMSLLLWIIVAIFGLLAVFVMVILRLLGVPI